MGLTRMDWRARQLVGPDVNPKLTVLENNVEALVRSHVHGKVDFMEGDTPVYEAAPLDPALIPISDPLNPSNTNLEEHMADEGLHDIEAATAPRLRFFTGTCNLKQPVDSGPDNDEGSISQSWYSGSNSNPSLVRPQRNFFHATWSPFGSSGYLGNCFSLAFQGAKQRDGFPTPFAAKPPYFGRVFQNALWNIAGGGIVSSGAVPTAIAFDYLLFPFRTWYHLYGGNQAFYNNPPYSRTVNKRFRSASFPDDFRAPNPTQAKLFWQMRAELGHTLQAANVPLRDIYWPDTDEFDELGHPVGQLESAFTVPTLSQYAIDPGNPFRQYVSIEQYLRHPGVHSDFSTMHAASQNAVTIKDVWRDFRSAAGAGGDDYFGDIEAGQWIDWMYPLQSNDNWGLRVLWQMHNDNQVDVFPFVPVGWMVILPYGYLPLYIEDSTIDTDIPNDVGKMWASAPLTFGSCGSVIEWQPRTGGDISIPRLVSQPGAGPQTFAYPYPKAINIDYLLVVPE